MFVPYNVKASAAAVALALASISSHAVLERAGPVDASPSGGNYPAWYQDTTGITLDFCTPSNDSELAGGWCLLLTGDTVAPEVFPTSFFDEHFYFAAVAQIGTRQAGGKALLVLAEEAAFATGAPIPGDQITFSRIRVVLNPVPLSGTYRFIHPYGEESITAVAGDRIFFTDDIGIACARGDFNCATTSRLGPFLLPSATPGGPEMAALTASNTAPDTDPAHFGGAFAATPYPNTGKAYIADPARIGPITGSSLPNFIDSQGNSRNHNMFRIEGPIGSGLGLDSNGVPVDWLETTDFSLMGRLHDGAMPGRSTIERASYTRNATGTKVDVLAIGTPTTLSRLPTQPAAVKIPPALSFFDAPCDATTPEYSVPKTVGVRETQMLSMGSQYWGQVRVSPTAIPGAVCVKNGNARDANNQTIAVYTPQVVADEVSISQAVYDQVNRTMTVTATSSDTLAPPVLRLAYPTYAGGNLTAGTITVPAVDVPPATIKVLSSALGTNELQVKTPLTVVAPPPPPPAPVAVNDSFTFAEDAAAQTINPRVNDLNCALSAAQPCTMTIVTQPTHARANLVPTTTQAAPGPTVSYRSVANYNGPDSFTYTLSKGGVTSAPATVSITITPVNDAPVAVNDAATAVRTAGGTARPNPISINLIANDTDPDGNADVRDISNLSGVACGRGTATVARTAAGVATVTFGATTTRATTCAFTYRARDAINTISGNTGTVTITVQ